MNDAKRPEHGSTGAVPPTRGDAHGLSPTDQPLGGGALRLRGYHRQRGKHAIPAAGGSPAAPLAGPVAPTAASVASLRLASRPPSCTRSASPSE